METTKIVILGLGGVGGFYGGKLAKRYAVLSNIGIYFIARGLNLQAIQQSGIQIITDSEDFIAKPTLATDNAEEIGVADYIIIATKSYHLQSSIDQIRPCVGANTVIIPLLNGGDITERIRKILPDNIIWSGCSYIVSRRIAPGIIRTSGTFHKLVFGFDGGENHQLYNFEKLLREAEIDVNYSKKIRESVWRKFFFISVSASLTSYLNCTFNELVNTKENKEMTIRFAKEFLSVAQAEGIDLGENPLEHIVNRSEVLPVGTTTSMHSDFKAGRSTELETLTGVVIELAHKHKISVPLYQKVYDELKNR